MKAKKFQDGEDHVEENSNQNDEIRMNFNNDYRYFSRSSIGILIQDKYCKCGRVRSAYDEKLSNYGVKTNDFYEVDKLANKVFELNNRNAIYLTKKSLMLNQFLEYTEASAVCNESSPNRLNLKNTTSQLKCGSTLDVLQCSQNKNSRTLCLPSSLLLSDKRLASLFRSVALYWFFCLNTVLAKGEIYKRKTLTVLDLHQTDQISQFAVNSEINISTDILQSFDDLSNDFSWKILFNLSRRSSSLLVYAEHSLENFQEMLRNHSPQYILERMTDLVGTISEGNNLTECVSTAAGRKSAFCKIVRKFSPNVSDYGYAGSSFNQNIWRKRAMKNRSKMSKRLCTSFHNHTYHLLPNEEFYSDEEIIDILNVGTVWKEYEGIEVAKPSEESSSADESDVEIVVDDDESDAEIVVDDDVPSRSRISPIGAELPVAGTTSSVSAEISKINGTPVSSSELEDEHYLPTGMLNGEDYPPYNIWEGISIDVLPRWKPFGNPSQQNNGRNPPPPLERNNAAILNAPEFRSYRLWESTPNVDQQYVPNFYSNDNLSVFSMPYYPPPYATVARNVAPSTVIGSAVERNAEPFYSLWKSPNIIDCLASRRDPQDLNRQCALVGLLLSAPSERNDLAERRYWTSFTPNKAKYVELTESGGAFRRYRRSPFEPRRVQLLPSDSGNGIPNNTNVGITTKKVTLVYQYQYQFRDLTSPNIFLPIHPDMGVNTDMPAFIERSLSGTMFYNNRMLLNYEREMNSTCDPWNFFQPKFVVNEISKACQTDFNGDEAGRLGNLSGNKFEGGWAPSNLSRLKNVSAVEQPHARNPVDQSWEEILSYLSRTDMDNLGKHEL